MVMVTAADYTGDTVVRLKVVLVPSWLPDDKSEIYYIKLHPNSKHREIDTENICFQNCL